ncbi:MAG: hypothetical protein ACXWAB_11005 [Methylobacter sp.]
MLLIVINKSDIFLKGETFMKRFYHFHRQAHLSVVMALAVTVLSVFTPLSQKAHAASTQTPWQNLTQSQLTAAWWQWLYSVPASQSPAIDPTGVNAYNGQPYSSLLFLPGTFVVQQLATGDVVGKVTRTIDVKQGTALFFPLINAEFDNVCARPSLGGNCFGAQTFPNVQGVSALQAEVTSAVNPVTGLFATLTPNSGTLANIPSTRLLSPPFSYTLPSASDNLLGINVTSLTVAPVAADGYFAFIPGILAPGEYLLHFGGTVPNFDGQGHTFSENITYNITVTP